jgi:hypothetical protein
MAQVIKGAFPQAERKAEKDIDKPVPNYILHISIAFSDPLIWRRMQVPGKFNLSQLHDIIQQSMGWSDHHVHQFLIGKICYEPTIRSNTLREAKRFDENKYKLHILEEDMRFMFTYLYSAGEGWEHQIQLEEIVPPTPGLNHPVLIDGQRACPPETIGDIHEYQALLAAFETPGHKKQNRLCDLAGSPDFDPAFFDLEAARKRVGTCR